MAETAPSTNTDFEDEYFAGGSKRDGTYADYDFDAYREYYRHYLAFFKDRFNRGERMLEVGCAKGALVASLCEQGFDAFGVDVSKYAVGSAPAEVRARLSVVDLDSLAAGPEPSSRLGRDYAVVIALGVLEYTKSPGTVLRAVRSSLDPKGPTDRPCLLIKTLSSTASTDKLRVNCLPRAEWLATAEACGFAYDAAASTEFERLGFDALHAFALGSSSLQGKVYRLASRLLGTRLALSLLRRKNANLLFLAFRRLPA